MLEEICPILIKDWYKVHHPHMYDPGMTKLYSNLTPRKSRIEGINEVVVFGPQAFITEHLIYRFNKYFFHRDIKSILQEYEEITGLKDLQHIADLHALGYLPLEIKSLDEGTLCPIGVPCLTITNTHDDFGWLVNNLETYISLEIWKPITSATIAKEYRKILDKYAIETTGSTDFVAWQGHDFSMRGMDSISACMMSGMGHLLSFTGTDTIPAIWAAKKLYKATGLIGGSVPATEHSVMCMGTKEDELSTFRRLMKTYPTGILSIVSDTWDLWKVCTEYLPTLKKEIMARDGKIVIRPDSGDPVEIICGVQSIDVLKSSYGKRGDKFYDKNRGCVVEIVDFIYESDGHIQEYIFENANNYSVSRIKGVVELLWDIFGGTTNDLGYKVLDSHIGAIYGDSITLDRAKQICERLKAKGFASTNVVFGIGSYTYQYNTRDTFGFAVKATYGEIKRDCPKHNTKPCTCGRELCGIEAREIWKDPITDDGTKKSKKGLLQVYSQTYKEDTREEYTVLEVKDQCTWEEEKQGLLTTVFLNGKLVKETTFEEIRERLKK